MRKHWLPAFAGLGFCLCVLAGTLACRREKVLNLYNWSDYFAPDTLSGFQKETGIKVRYDAYDSDETLQSKLLTGDSGYDLVWPTNDFMAKQIQAGAFRPLDKSRLPNLKYLDPALLKTDGAVRSRQSVRRAVYVGHRGRGFTTARRSALSSARTCRPIAWSAVQPGARVAHRRALRHRLQDWRARCCRWRCATSAAIRWNPTAQDYAVAQTMLLKVRPYIHLFVDSANANELIDGELCVDDRLLRRDQPRRAEGAAVGQQARHRLRHAERGHVDVVRRHGHSETAKHPDNAHAFINYSLAARRRGEISNATRYANANQGALKLMDPALRNNPECVSG